MSDSNQYNSFAVSLSTILRIRNNMSGADLARKIGQNPATVNGWLRGEGRPGVPELIDAMARVLRLSEEERVGLLYDADYGWYVEAGTYRKIEDSDTVEHVRAEAQKKGIDSYIVDKILHMLTRHPSPEYEFSSNKTVTRIVLSASTLLVTGLIIISFLMILSPSSISTLRRMIERPFTNDPLPTATRQIQAPSVAFTSEPLTTATSTAITKTATATPDPTATLVAAVVESTPTMIEMTPTPEPTVLVPIATVTQILSVDASIASANYDGEIYLIVDEIELLSTGRMRWYISFWNKTSRNASMAFGSEQSYVVDELGTRYAILSMSPSRFIDLGVQAGVRLQGWLDFDAPTPGAQTFKLHMVLYSFGSQQLSFGGPVEVLLDAPLVSE